MKNFGVPKINFWWWRRIVVASALAAAIGWWTVVGFGSAVLIHYSLIRK